MWRKGPQAVAMLQAGDSHGLVTNGHCGAGEKMLDPSPLWQVLSWGCWPGAQILSVVLVGPRACSHGVVGWLSEAQRPRGRSWWVGGVAQLSSWFPVGAGGGPGV